MVSSSLTVLAADRHAFQTSGVQMLEQALNGVHKQMKKAVADAQAKVDNADREKASRAAALAGAEKNVEALEQKAATAKSTHDNAKTTLHDAKAGVSTAAANIKSKAAELDELAEMKAKVTAALAETFEPGKAAKVKAASVHSLEKILRDIELEEGLIEHMPETLKKDAEARGTFDGIVMKAVGDGIAAYLAKAETGLANGEKSKAALENAKTQADGALTAAEASLTASTEALHAAEAALKTGKEEKRTAAGAVSGFDREMTEAASHLQSAKEDLETFTENALSGFGALKALAPPPEPEPAAPAAAAEAVAAEPAA